MTRRAAPGVLTVSLDLELHWGISATMPLSTTKELLLRTRQAIPALLSLFERYGIHATWATVGCLLFDTRHELLSSIPDTRPSYTRSDVSPYQCLSELGRTEKEDPFHYGLSLVQKIASTPGQEIATHTFSHYYCLEQGSSPAAFSADLEAAQRRANQLGLNVRSIVFPRNQVADGYLPRCRDAGLTGYRGNPPTWFYASEHTTPRPLTYARRAGRLADAYIPVTGSNIYPLDTLGSRSSLLNIPASRFVRLPARARWGLDSFRVRRIKREMSQAARAGHLYHLWWHPHNVGKAPRSSLDMLRAILLHYAELRHLYGMRSLNMAEAQEIIGLTEDCLDGD